jgi:putative glutamine amidotransferase
VLPLIGITCGSVHGGPRRPDAYRLNQSYVRAIELAGGAAVLIPPIGPGEATRRLYDAVDAVLLPGGADLQPETYGADRHPSLGETDPDLDRTELALARWALSEGKPVLGICRGQQCLNVAAGGTLFQDIPSEIDDALGHRVEPRNVLAHPIAIRPDSRLAAILGVGSVEVNSLHHQSVRDVAPGLVVTAQAPDGVIEGLEQPAHFFALSVQFHPEELVPGHEPSERLLRAFVLAAAHHQ